MTRTLKVETLCGRCGRTEEVTMDMAAAVDLDKEDEARDVADQGLEKTLNEVLDESYPDIVVAVRNKDGSYAVKGLRNLCDQPGAKRNKGCATRVKALINDIFMVPNPKPKKKEEPILPGTEEGTTPPSEPKDPKDPKDSSKPKGGKKK